MSEGFQSPAAAGPKQVRGVAGPGTATCGES